jgi:hypothetical protein
VDAEEFLGCAGIVNGFGNLADLYFNFWGDEYV